jgi:hypothetical protein
MGTALIFSELVDIFLLCILDSTKLSHIADAVIPTNCSVSDADTAVQSITYIVALIMNYVLMMTVLNFEYLKLEHDQFHYFH